MAQTINDLIEGNEKWVEEVKADNPDFFNKLALGQTPQFLWIGCSDSRVPATQITDATPGSIFVQRNIANVVVNTDANLLSVVNYAVKYLKVKHIIVCGHYGCGGVKAAMSNDKFGFLDGWLGHIKDVYAKNREELDGIADEEARFDRYVELNVQAQVQNMAKISFIQEEWDKGEFPYIHGWVYGLKDGKVKDLKVTINSHMTLSPVYRYAK